jgi:hypothetical protein
VEISLPTIFANAKLSELADVVVVQKLSSYSTSEVGELDNEIDNLSEAEILSLLNLG